MIREVGPDEYDLSAQSGAALDVHRIAGACDAADGATTLNEQTLLRLKHHGLDGARLWVADDEGFALVHGETLDLAVRPDARGHGLGTTLATAALRDLPRVEAWSHADHPAAARIADRFGVARERELKIMSRPTELPLGNLPAPDGVRIRTFRPGDTDRLVEINAAAFAHHPEQGGLTAADFAERAAEPWFDPEGLFLAVSDRDESELLGFHWTKVHRDEEPPYGEVYVVAVDPGATGRGLGKLLTVAGLRHLAGVGVEEVILYVDGDNDPAVALYAGLGFHEVRTEVQYRGVPRT